MILDVKTQRDKCAQKKKTSSRKSIFLSNLNNKPIYRGCKTAQLYAGAKPG